MTRRDPTMDRRALFASAAAATLLAASGVSAAGLPQRGGRLRLALSGAARSDTWHKGDGLFMQVARQGLVFDTLTEVSADGTLRGELATAWRASPDARHWEFDLREDVLFHDGQPFSAKDVLASAAGFADGTLRALTPHRLSVTLHAADPCLPLRFAAPEFYIAPAHAPDSGIGTGLYRVKDFVAGQHLLSERVAGHYKGDGVGWFDMVELSSVPSEPVRAEALGAYMVDAVDVADADLLAGLPDIATLPASAQMNTAVSRDLAQPDMVGAERPLDNLRAAERWWFV